MITYTNVELIYTSEFFENPKLQESPRGECDFSFLENSQVQINSKFNEINRMITNNINMKKFAWMKCRFLKQFFSFEKTIFKVLHKLSSTSYVISLASKNPIVFQRIIIQNYDVYFAMVLTFWTAVSQSEPSNFFMYIMTSIIILVINKSDFGLAVVRLC